MAKKLLLMKMLQEFRSYEQVTNRCPVPRPPALYLMQMRERLMQPHLTRRLQRVAITTQWQNSNEVALPIRINHLQAGQTEIPIVIG